MIECGERVRNKIGRRTAVVSVGTVTVAVVAVIVGAADVASAKVSLQHNFDHVSREVPQQVVEPTAEAT